LVTHRVPIESFVPFGHAPLTGLFMTRYGDRHGVSPSVDDRTFDPAPACPSAGRVVQAGPGAQIWGQTRCPTRTWGQTRCPVYRSGTFNVQHSTLNFQRSDRKGACWAEYGDRHEIRTTGLLTRRSCPSAGRTVRAGWSAQIWGQTRCPT